MITLEATNHKVNSKGWKIKDGIADIKGKETKIKYKINKEGDIREYYKGFPKEFIGEQLFTYDALVRLGLEKRLPTFEQIKELKEPILAGYWYPNYEKFYNVGERSTVWLVGGNYANFYQYIWYGYYYNRTFGFSGRLLKELDTSDDLTIGQLKKEIDKCHTNTLLKLEALQKKHKTERTLEVFSNKELLAEIERRLK